MPFLLQQTPIVIGSWLCLIFCVEYYSRFSKKVTDVGCQNDGSQEKNACKYI